MAIPEHVRFRNLEERMVDALCRIKSLETQMLEKTDDIQQLADEAQVIRNLTGVQDILEEGARAVSTEPDVSCRSFPPPEDIVQVTAPFEVYCSRCRSLLYQVDERGREFYPTPNHVCR